MYLSVTLFWGILLGEANIFPIPGTSDGTHCSEVSSKDQTIVSIFVLTSEFFVDMEATLANLDIKITQLEMTMAKTNTVLQSAKLVGSITSRCSGNEPALLPRGG